MGYVPKVVIVGGGFGGLAAAQALAREPVDVVLLDRTNYHLFQPLLYQVATGGLSPANISMPLRTILRRQKNARVLMGEVIDFDLVNNRVLVRDGQPLMFDYLIVAAGAGTSYFRNPGWELLAPGLKSIEDARQIRTEVLTAFERAESLGFPLPSGALDFVVVGGGPTGVEMAGAIAELSRLTMRGEFRAIRSEQARVILVENGPRVLGAFSPESSGHALDSLRKLGVEVRLEAMVKDVAALEGYPSRLVKLEKAGVVEELPCAMVVWGAGVQASALAAKLAAKTGQTLDRGGRIPVGQDGSILGFSNVFAVGDMAALVPDGAERALPGVAPVAQQLARHVAAVIGGRVRGEPDPGPFVYVDRGNMATIGRAAAVAETFGMRLKGFLAWMAWLFIHLLLLVGFQNRLLVLTQWAANYLTYNRAARLITPLASKNGKDKPQVNA